MIELPRACLMAGDDRADRGVLLVRHQRPDADHLRHQPRRRRELPRHLCRQGHPGDRSVHLGRSRRRRRTRQDRRRARPQDAARSQGRHLRRAWRRSGLRRVLPRDRARLRLLLALPRADRRASPPRRPRSARRSPARRRSTDRRPERRVPSCPSGIVCLCDGKRCRQLPIAVSLRDADAASNPAIRVAMMLRCSQYAFGRVDCSDTVQLRANNFLHHFR